MDEKRVTMGVASTADRPDLGWSQVRETVLMLGVAVGRIESAMRDGAESVDVLAELISDLSKIYNPGELVGIQEKIKARYTLEEERVMFEAIMKGAGIDEALAAAVEYRRNAQQQTDNVELF